MRSGHAFDFVYQRACGLGAQSPTQLLRTSGACSSEPQGRRVADHDAGFSAGRMLRTTRVERRSGPADDSDGLRCRKGLLM